MSGRGRGNLNIRLELEFDGRRYFGWQFQPNRPTVQGELEKALARLFGVKVGVIGMGRTDTGVSALDFPANFIAPRPIELRVIPPALNQFLPDDIRVRRARRVRDDFHARYDARSKLYRYTIVPERSPLLAARAWEVLYPLDTGVMEQGLKLLPGERDFAPFCRLTEKTSSKAQELKSSRDDGDAVGPGRVKLIAARLRRRGCAIAGRPLIQLEFEADRFLYKMVRRLAGALVDVGRGKYSLADLRQALEDRPRVQFVTAPACGLVLVRARY